MIYSSKSKKLKINKENMYVIMDFDKTITACDSADSWSSAANPKIFGKEIDNEMNNLYKKYRPIEIDYNISNEEKTNYMVKWYSECMDLYYKHNLSKEKLQQSIKISDIRFRKGAKELLIKLHNEGIPLIIMSAGIGNTIKEFLKNNNCLFEENMEIISNFLEFDKNGNIMKFDNSKIIHTLNKNINGRISEKFINKIKDKKYKILLGDLIEDMKMVDETQKDTTLYIGVLAEKMKEKLDLYRSRFDVVLTSEEDINEFFEKYILKD